MLPGVPRDLVADTALALEPARRQGEAHSLLRDVDACIGYIEGLYTIQCTVLYSVHT